MTIEQISSQQMAEYNRFVATNSSGSFLQSWEWGEWQSLLGRQVTRFQLKDDSGEIVGTIQLVKMPLPLGKHYWYAPYGPVVNGSEDQIIGELKKKFSDAIFLRFEPKSDYLVSNNPYKISKTANIQPGKSLLVDLTKTEEELLAQMHPKTRYNIKLAQKHAVQIKDEFAISVGHGLFFDEALKLILQTSQRQRFKTFSADYYKKLIDFFTFHNQGGLHLHIYKAIFNNQLLAAGIMIDFGQVRTFLFGGSSEANKNVMAPYLLHWQAMIDAKNSGLKFYDFWGVETSGGETPGFVRFKLGFGGEVKKYNGAYDVAQNVFYYKIYYILRAINKLISNTYR